MRFLLTSGMSMATAWSPCSPNQLSGKIYHGKWSSSSMTNSGDTYNRLKTEMEYSFEDNSKLHVHIVANRISVTKREYADPVVESAIKHIYNKDSIPYSLDPVTCEIRTSVDLTESKLDRVYWFTRDGRKKQGPLMIDDARIMSVLQEIFRADVAFPYWTWGMPDPPKRSALGFTASPKLVDVGTRISVFDGRVYLRPTTSASIIAYTTAFDALHRLPKVDIKEALDAWYRVLLQARDAGDASAVYDAEGPKLFWAERAVMNHATPSKCDKAQLAKTVWFGSLTLPTNDGATYNRVTSSIQLRFIDANKMEFGLVANKVAVSTDSVVESFTRRIYTKEPFKYELDQTSCEIITYPALSKIKLHSVTWGPLRDGGATIAYPSENVLENDLVEIFSVPSSSVVASPQLKEGQVISMFGGMMELAPKEDKLAMQLVETAGQYVSRTDEHVIKEAQEFWTKKQ